MKKIGLALGGGAVLGAAHIGVLKALIEKEVRIEYVTGTSIGAFVAALFAFGKNWEEINEISCKLKWMDISSISLSKYSLLSNDKIGELLVKHIGEKNLEEASIPLAIIATDAGSGEKVVLKKGPVADAVMASTCIPGLFKPVKIDGRMLLDGGIVENVPIKTLRDIGAEFVVGVDLNAEHEYQEPQNILDVLLNSFHFIMQQSAKYQTQNADLLIKPNLSAFDRADTSQIEDLIQQGYEDANTILNEKDLDLSSSNFNKFWNRLRAKFKF